MANENMRRFFGGSPLGVIVRLLLLSVIVGFVLSFFTLDPLALVNSLVELVRAIFDLGYGLLGSLWHYLLLGAVVVIPIWLISRYVQTRKQG